MMDKALTQNQYNPKNERIKYDYKIYLSKYKGRDEKTLKAVLQHIREFETFIEFREFIILSEYIIHNYIDELLSDDLSLSYIDHNVKAVKDFYTWLERQRGYKSKIRYEIIEYFRLTTNQRNEAKVSEYQERYTLDEIFKTVSKMPSNTMLEQRNKAMISLQALCGLRISEIRTMKIKNLIFNKDTQSYMIYVNPKDMDVKFAKVRSAFFMPFDEALKDNVLSWKTTLESLGFTAKDSFFPIIPNRFNQINLLSPKIQKEAIKSNSTIIDIFKTAFQSAGYEYHRPHSFRHTIANWAEQNTPQFFNAVSISLGHSSVATTFQSYGNLTPTETGRIISGK